MLSTLFESEEEINRCFEFIIGTPLDLGHYQKFGNNGAIVSSIFSKWIELSPLERVITGLQANFSLINSVRFEWREVIQEAFISRIEREDQAALSFDIFYLFHLFDGIAPERVMALEDKFIDRIDPKLIPDFLAMQTKPSNELGDRVVRLVSDGESSVEFASDLLRHMLRVGFSCSKVQQVFENLDFDEIAHMDAIIDRVKQQEDIQYLTYLILAGMDELKADIEKIEPRSVEDQVLKHYAMGNEEFVDFDFSELSVPDAFYLIRFLAHNFKTYPARRNCKRLFERIVTSKVKNDVHFFKEKFRIHDELYSTLFSANRLCKDLMIKSVRNNKEQIMVFDLYAHELSFHPAFLFLLRNDKSFFTKN